MRDGASPCPARVMSMGFAAAPVTLLGSGTEVGAVLRPALPSGVALAEAGNTRGEQGTAALPLLHVPWRSGKVYELETRAAGESAKI